MVVVSVGVAVGAAVGVAVGNAVGVAVGVAVGFAVGVAEQQLQSRRCFDDPNVLPMALQLKLVVVVVAVVLTHNEQVTLQLSDIQLCVTFCKNLDFPEYWFEGLQNP